MLQRYEAGEVERQPMLDQSHAWQALENELRTESSELYYEARQKGCL